MDAPPPIGAHVTFAAWQRPYSKDPPTPELGAPVCRVDEATEDGRMIVTILRSTHEHLWPVGRQFCHEFWNRPTWIVLSHADPDDPNGRR